MPALAGGEPAVSYRLDATAPGSGRVQVSLTFGAALEAPVTLVMPRNYPGGYALVLYDRFVENVLATSPAGSPLGVARAAFGPRWDVGKAGERVQRIDYDVDVARMERELLSAVETSKIRPGYAGLLGYSLFGYVDGLEHRPVALSVRAPDGWSVLTTLAAGVPAPKGAATAQAPNFDVLADSQILMGPGLQLRRLDGAIPLVLAVYSEGEVDLALEGSLARTALDCVQAYFGDTPIRQYTVQLELLKPLPGHDYGFSQEHFDSGSFSLATSRATTVRSTADERATTLMNYAHHMAHSWIPKRAYGAGYAPHTWELPPVIDTIWFNEGFGRYAALQALTEGMPPEEGAAFRIRSLAQLKNVVDRAPPFIRRMPLLVLSREASFMFSGDFRIGRNVYSRGALMAAEMDDRIRASTGGTRSLRDALRQLLKTPQPFRIEELPAVFRDATGVDVHDILDRWMR
jgi:predicted metalloprotease with PDZ domain